MDLQRDYFFDNTDLYWYIEDKKIFRYVLTVFNITRSPNPAATGSDGVRNYYIKKSGFQLSSNLGLKIKYMSR